MLWNSAYILLGVALFALLAGYLIGSHRSRRSRRRMQRDLNQQALDLLDARAELNTLQTYADQQERRDNLLKLSLQRLQRSNRHNRNLADLLNKQEKKHFVELAQLRLKAAQSNETAQKAAHIARKAMVHLKRLETASPITQTIEAHEPKSYGNGEPVTVSVVDQERLDKPRDTAAPVSNRDSARLSKLKSSNEATVPTA